MMEPMNDSQLHRPWPRPRTRWWWRQRWSQLAFIHWEVPVELVRTWLPDTLEVDTWNGKTYLGIVPFLMQDVRPRWGFSVPGLSNFPEINVRIYVTDGHKPGVWFLSLDATQQLAVWAARNLFHLPYYRADIGVQSSSDAVRYQAQRRKSPLAFDAEYGPVGPVIEALSGSLEHWLTERYCLYALHPRLGLCRSEVHHLPWPLQQAKLDIKVNTLASEFVDLTRPPEHVHFAADLDVVMWPIRPLEIRSGQ